MQGIAVGIDFGTSNTAAAIPGKCSGSPAEVLALDATAHDPRLLRSVLFFPEESTDVLFGSPAIERYLVEGGGRLLLSIKSLLPSQSFQSTEIRKRSWPLEDLIASLLAHLRVRLESTLGGPIDRAVFGRPALFSSDPEKDRMAEERLARAARIAGFPEPVFLIEPIAAALRYEESLERDETVLVADFGAGTSDFTLIRLGPGHRERLDRRSDVIASHGLYVGGDRFDAAIVENRLLPLFGNGSTFQSMTSRVTIPAWMTRRLLAWHELSLLREHSTMEFLRKAMKSSDAPEAVENLITLVEENLAYHLYRAVEATKRRLSTAESATLEFHASGIEIEERVTRAQFERWTKGLREELDGAVDRVLEKAGGEQPDAVFLTGGTSNIPSVRRLFAKRFGEARLRDGDAFTSVAAGLGRMAGVATA